MNRQMPLFLALLLAVTLIPLGARADSRLFTYSYQADSILEKGKWEFEQWVTYKGGRESGNFYQFDLREEIETGLTDRLTTALYLNLRDVHREGVTGATDLDRLEFKGISSEWKYMVSSPNLHPLGLLLYLEPTYEGEEFKLEGKVVLQHNFGDKVVWVLNGVIEPEWEFEPAGTAKELELEFDTGLAYKFSPHWSVGLEVRDHNEFVDFKDFEHSVLFAGPNIHYEGAKGWATFTLLPQIMDLKNGGRNLEEHESIEARLIAGILF